MHRDNNCARFHRMTKAAMTSTLSDGKPPICFDQLSDLLGGQWHGLLGLLDQYLLVCAFVVDGGEGKPHEDYGHDDEGDYDECARACL